ncbi:MAG: stage III sporulation protein AA [Symbiobacteriia bacterium]
MKQWTEVWAAFPTLLAQRLERGAGRFPAPVEEIRLRQGRPLMLVGGGQDRAVTETGDLTRDLRQAYLATADDLARTVQLLSQNSLYAWEDEIRQGFLTLPGGHRAGLTGRAVVEQGRVRTLKQVSGICLRLAREVRGAADGVLQLLRASWQGPRPPNLLLFSAPQAGKTTVLRDLVRQYSSGAAVPGLPGLKVGLVDERCELAASFCGVPQLDVGPRTDVLDACPKAEGLMMLIRSMSPEVVATDEIGRPEDGLAVQEALGAGVTVIATAHGGSLAELARRPVLRDLLAMGAFDAAAMLGRSRGPGTVEGVWLLAEEAGRDALAEGVGQPAGDSGQCRQRAAGGFELPAAAAGIGRPAIRAAALGD